MCSQINSLQKEIRSMKKSSPSTAIFKCDECGYKASTKTVFTRGGGPGRKGKEVLPKKGQDYRLKYRLGYPCGF